jgi:hypothetical protein
MASESLMASQRLSPWISVSDCTSFLITVRTVHIWGLSKENGLDRDQVIGFFADKGPKLFV